MDANKLGAANSPAQLAIIFKFIWSSLSFLAPLPKAAQRSAFDLGLPVCF